MKRYLLIALVLSACGSQKPATSGAAWPTQDIETFLSGCEATADQQPNVTVSQAQLYCGCLSNVVESRWSSSDYSANAAADDMTLYNDGTVKSCKTQAGL